MNETTITPADLVRGVIGEAQDGSYLSSILLLLVVGILAWFVVVPLVLLAADLVRMIARRPYAVSVLAAGLAVALPGVAILTAGTAHAQPAPVANVAPAWMVTPCEYEDSANCYWDATTAGNGVGHSFYAVVMGPEVCRFYWAPRDVKLNACLDNPYA